MKDNLIMTKTVDMIEFEITDVLELGDNNYLTGMDIQTLILLVGRQYKKCIEITESDMKRCFDWEDYKIVSEITEAILQGEWIVSNQFYLNILNNGDRELIYKDGRLTINNKSEIALLEGYRNYLAFEKALEVEPNLKWKVTVAISHKTIEGLHEWFAQRCREI